MAEPRGVKLRLGLLAAVAVLLVLAEIAAIVWVASEIGWWTVLILAGTTVIGIALLVREGGKAWKGLTDALKTGELKPGRLTDATLVLVGGMLLVLPGLLTDVAGLLLLLPFTRPFVRSAITWWASRTFKQPETNVIKGDVVRETTLIPGIEKGPDHPGTGDEPLEGTIIDDRSQ